MKSFLCRKNAMYLALAVIGLSLAVTTHVFAQTTTEATSSEAINTATSSDDVAADREATPESSTERNSNERTNEQREAAAERVEERRSVIAEQQQNRLINLARNMKGKMEAAVSRLSQITTRLERRITKLNAEGTDTTEAMRYVEETKTSLSSATLLLNEIDGAFIRAVSSDTPRQQFVEVRRQFSAIRDHIHAAHAALRNAVRVLKNPTGTADLISDENTGTTSATSNEAEATSSDQNNQE